MINANSHIFSSNEKLKKKKKNTLYISVIPGSFRSSGNFATDTCIISLKVVHEMLCFVAETQNEKKIITFF